MIGIITRVALALATLVLVLRPPMVWALPVSSCATDFSSCNIYEDGSIFQFPSPFTTTSGDVVLLDSDNSVSDVFRIFNNVINTGGGTGLGNTAFLYSDDEGNLPNPNSYSTNAISLTEGLTETDFNDNGTIQRRACRHTASRRTTTIRHRHRRLRSARLVQEAEGAGGRLIQK